MFQLSINEVKNLRRSLLYAFTEEGIAMLSGILRSKKAVQVNVEIITRHYEGGND